MYAVVGCGDCSALWLVEGRPETSECPRCGTTRRHELRRKFVTTEDEDHAREVRASMLASRADESESFAALDSFAELESRVEEAGVDPETYLDESGVDTEAVAAAVERSERGPSTSGSREETVRAALRDLDRPTEAEVVAYASERGVPADYTERALAKLSRAGEVTETDGGYRLV
jgi:hypothetical protein